MTTMQRERPLRIAVLGAGYVGSAVASTAAARGHAVWAVRRSAVEMVQPGVTWLRGSVSAGSIDGLPDALDVVVLTVAPSSGRDEYASTYPPAAAGALAVARDRGAGTVIYTSSTGVYGGRAGEWVTESSPRRGEGAGNAALIAAEDLLLEAEGPGVHILRVAGIYGPGRDPRARMRDAASLPERGEYWTNLAHRDDIVAAVLHVAERPVTGALFNVSDGQPALAAEVARWLTTAAGGDAEGLVFANDAQRSRNNQRVSSVALQATGWAPIYPSFRDGFTRGL